MNFLNPQRPMTPQEISRLRSQIESKELGMAMGNYAPNVGGGFHAIADGIALRTMRNRLNSQFPQAPGAQAQPGNSILGALTGGGLNNGGSGGGMLRGLFDFFKGPRVGGLF